MAFSATNPPREIVVLGQASAGALFYYRSSDAATDVVATGYFASCGALGKTNLANMRIGDAVLVVESSLGVTPGRASWHGVTASTAHISSATPTPSSAFTQGFDVTVAAHAST